MTEGAAAGRDESAPEQPPQLLAGLARRDVTEALLRPLGAAVVLLTGYFVLPINKESNVNYLGLMVGAILLAAFCVWEVRRFARSTRPVATAMEMLVALASFYIVVFATTYFLFSDYAHGSFNERLTKIDALYFCLTVFTTTGFGDIAPDSEAARVAVSIQMASTLVLLGLGLRFLNVLITVRRRDVDPLAAKRNRVSIWRISFRLKVQNAALPGQGLHHFQLGRQPLLSIATGHGFSPLPLGAVGFAFGLDVLTLAFRLAHDHHDNGSHNDRDGQRQPDRPC